MKKIFKIAAVILVVIIGFCGYVVYDMNHIRVTEYDIYSTKLPKSFEGYKIAVFSDYHNAPYYEQALLKTREQKPDVIFLLGDMINDSETEHENAKALVKGLLEIAPVYSVSGNHEMWCPNYKDFRCFLIENGVHQMTIEGTELKKDNASILLYGIGDFSVTDDQLVQSGAVKQVEDFSKKWVSPDVFNMLIIHRANMYPYIKDLNFDLIMSGHLHGGKVNIPGINSIVNELNDNIFTYAKGVHSDGHAKLVSSRGMDRNYSMPRIFNPPEIVVVTLKK